MSQKTSDFMGPGVRLNKIISGLKGVAKSAEDFLVDGKTVGGVCPKNDALLTRLAENKATLNLAKCIFHQTEVDFSFPETRDSPTHRQLEHHYQLQSNPEYYRAFRRFTRVAQQLSKILRKPQHHLETCLPRYIHVALDSSPPSRF